MSSLWRRLQKTSHRNQKLFFSILTRRLVESVEGLNSFLTLVAGDLWPKNCDPIYWLARSVKGFNEGILKPSNQSELCHAVFWCLNLAPTGSYSHKRKQLTSNKLAFSSGANFNARLWEATLTRANEALRDVERLTRPGCALQVNNTRIRLVRRLTSAVRGSLALARELRRPREVVSAHVPPHEVKRWKKHVYRRSLLTNWLVFNAINFNAINFTVNCTKPVSAQKFALFSKLWNVMATMAAIKDSPTTTAA